MSELMAPTTKRSCIVLFYFTLRMIWMRADISFLSPPAAACFCWEGHFSPVSLSLTSWSAAHLLGLGAGSPAVAQWGLVPCTSRDGKGTVLAARVEKLCFTHMPQCLLFVLLVMPWPWLSPAIHGLELVCEEALFIHALLPEETKGTARTGRGWL